MESLHTRRQKACDKLFKQILEDPNHKLNDLIPRTDVSINYQLRNVTIGKYMYRIFVLNVLKTRISSPVG